jgi:hypothetical protein
MTYRIFRRTWWLDAKCTKPGAGRRYYSGQTAQTAAEARDICAANNEADYGSPNGRGPRGAAWEFTS